MAPKPAFEPQEVTAMASIGLKFRGSTILGAGVVAGLLFALFEMVASALMQGPSFLYMPLRMIGAIILGPAALQATYPLDVAAVVGVLLHLDSEQRNAVVTRLVSSRPRRA
jgi:hypothetical protein